uniref:Coiled-coil domain containing 57 n=1 Tax=Ictidomys tridecemlineatus TaxID=43179 RepID=I3M9W1_ICTTR
MLPLCSEKTLSEMLSRKEEEWRVLQAHHTQMQEAALQDAQKQLEEAQGKLRRLQEDFLYNLRVLEERDLELEHYDAAFAQARGQEEARQAEVSELKVEVARLKQELAREARRMEELQQQQQRRAQEHHQELERVHSDKNGEISHQREQYENLKWRLERKLEELDGELALQRQELLLEFESEMQKREHEFRLQADGMSSVVLSQELKVLHLWLGKLSSSAGIPLPEWQATSALQARQLTQRLQQALSIPVQIKDLEDKLHSVQLTRKKEEEIFKRKHEELDRLARERDAMLVAVKGTHAEQLRALEARVLELQAHGDALEVQLRRAEWTQADAAREKDAVIDRLREDAAALKASWDAQVTQMSKEAVAKDLQVQTLREEEVKLQAQLARRQQDVARYKQELSLAVERERNLGRDQVQLNLDWQRRCDSIEREQIQRSEALIQGLLEARDQVTAKLQETERALREQEAVLRAVTLERDQAVEALQAQGLLPVKEFPGQHKGEMGSAFPPSEIQRLQDQNTSLRNAVAQMRREMEALSGETLPSAQSGENACTHLPEAEAAGDTAPPRYVLALAAEVQNLKHKLSALEGELAGSPGPPETSSGDAKLHPGALEGELADGQAPTGLALALRKLRDRVHLLNLLVTHLRKKVQQKPLELDTVHHELPREVDQVHVEVLELQKQVAELEKHLGTAQQVPASREGSQGLADERPVGTKDQLGAQPPQTLSVPHLQRKLKAAAKKILRLRLEKEQLLEMGNRLRAEQGHPKGTLPCPPRPPTPQAQDQGRAPEAPWDHSPPLGQRSVPSSTVLPPLSLPQPGQERGLPRQPCLSSLLQRTHEAPWVTCRPPQKENRPRKPLQAPVPEESSCLTRGSSSLASSSLQDTWRLLDLGSSPSGLPSQDDSAVACDRSPVKMQVAFTIKGMKMAAQSKAKPTRLSKSHPARPKSCQQLPRIRNYNWKD